MNEITQYPVGSAWGVPMVKKPTRWGGKKMYKYQLFYNGRWVYDHDNLEYLLKRFVGWWDTLGVSENNIPVTIVEV